MSNEYFKIWMERRNQLVRDSLFLKNAREGFRTLYSTNEGINHDFVKFNLVGQGDNHHILKVLNDLNLNSALRLKVHTSFPQTVYEPYSLDVWLARELGSFELAFEDGKNPPSFVGVASYELEGDRIAGLVVEDLSEGGFRVVSRNSPFGRRESDDKEFYVDPSGEYDNSLALERGIKYLDVSARIDL